MASVSDGSPGRVGCSTKPHVSAVAMWSAASRIEIFATGIPNIHDMTAWHASCTAVMARSCTRVRWPFVTLTPAAPAPRVRDARWTGPRRRGCARAGLPSWAALVAIADQGTTLLGQGTLDG